jgi:hypothetical protein
MPVLRRNPIVAVAIGEGNGGPPLFQQVLCSD